MIANCLTKAEAVLVDPGVAGFVFGLVAGWSALFTLPQRLSPRAMLVPLLWLGWLVLIAALAVRIGLPVRALLAGAAAGALAHEVMLRAIASRINNGGSTR